MFLEPPSGVPPAGSHSGGISAQGWWVDEWGSTWVGGRWWCNGVVFEGIRGDAPSTQRSKAGPLKGPLPTPESCAVLLQV